MANLSLNLTQGSVSFAFAPESAQSLQTALGELMADLKAIATHDKASGERPAPKRSMEYRCMGPVFFEVFCNPNIYPSPFAAKVLVTIRDDKIRVSTEAELTQLLEDLNQYLEANS